MRYLPSVTGTFATLTQKYPFSLKAGAVTTNTLTNIDTEILAELRTDLKCPMCNSQLNTFLIILIRNINMYINYLQYNFHPWKIVHEVQLVFSSPDNSQISCLSMTNPCAKGSKGKHSVGDWQGTPMVPRWGLHLIEANKQKKHKSCKCLLNHHLVHQICN